MINTDSPPGASLARIVSGEKYSTGTCDRFLGIPYKDGTSDFFGIIVSTGSGLDRVVLPPDNTEEFLENHPEYSLFLALIREFSQGEDLFPYRIGSFEPGLEKIILRRYPR